MNENISINDMHCDICICCVSELNNYKYSNVADSNTYALIYSMYIKGKFNSMGTLLISNAQLTTWVHVNFYHNSYILNIHVYRNKPYH